MSVATGAEVGAVAEAEEEARGMEVVGTKGDFDFDFED